MIRYNTSIPVAIMLILFPIFGFAKAPLINHEQSYAEAKSKLESQGWRPIKNLKIQDSSLYAQEVFTHGFVEVVDCISMERDSCLFRLSKNKQVLEVKTFGKDLKVDSYKLINNSKR